MKKKNYNPSAHRASKTNLSYIWRFYLKPHTHSQTAKKSNPKIGKTSHVHHLFLSPISCSIAKGKRNRNPGTFGKLTRFNYLKTKNTIQHQISLTIYNSVKSKHPKTEQRVCCPEAANDEPLKTHRWMLNEDPVPAEGGQSSSQAYSKALPFSLLKCFTGSS